MSTCIHFINPDDKKDIKFGLGQDIMDDDDDVIDSAANLHFCIRNDDYESVKRLLDAGVDPDEPDWTGSGRSPLLEAVSLGNVDIIKALIDAGCDVNVRNSQGECALHIAITSKTFVPDVVKTLLDADCNANIQENFYGYTPLHALSKQFSPAKRASCGKKLIETLEVLAKKSNVNVTDHRKATALHKVATYHGDYNEPIRVLLEAGANPSVQNDRGETPLLEALQKDCIEATKVLIESATDLTLTTRYKETALHVAAIKNLPEIVSMLLQKGCPPNEQDLNGNTALHLAAGKGYKSVVKLLLAWKDTGVNIPNKEGLTPLHVAVESGFLQVIEMLLQADSCDVMAKTKLNLTPYDLAQQEYRKRAQPQISRILTQAMEDCKRKMADNITADENNK